MKTTLSIPKADIGSIGGHICPSQQLLDRVKQFIENSYRGCLRPPVLGLREGQCIEKGDGEDQAAGLLRDGHAPLLRA